MSQQYSVTVYNNSTDQQDFCVFQKDPNISSSGNPEALAWFVKTMSPKTSGVFSWGIDYSFVWFESGTTAGGKVKYTVGEKVPADLSQNNQITLTYDKAFDFGPVSEGASSGTIFITEDSSVPLKQGSVGIGMAGSGTFAVLAEPNRNLAFTPKPEYWCTFGTYEVGQVMESSDSTQAKNIVFEGVSDVTLTLNADNTWSEGAPSRKAAK